MEKKVMSDYTLFCTPEQTKKALELGATLRIFTSNDSLIDSHWVSYNFGEYYTPTAEQMLGWLEEQSNIIELCIKKYGNWRYEIYIEPHSYLEEGGFNSRKEATLAAIDAALEYLIKHKNDGIN